MINNEIISLNDVICLKSNAFVAHQMRVQHVALAEVLLMFILNKNTIH